MLDRAFEHPMELEEKASAPFAGGIMQHGYQCGMIWGATLAGGAEAFRRHGPGPMAETLAIHAARGIVESFRVRHDEIDCFEISEVDKSSTPWEMFYHFLIKGGTVECFRMASWFAPLAYEEIESALSQEKADVPSSPVSCAAIMAQRLGASPQQAVMASGFAGGIGLCGGACGALGAAIWVLSMKIATEAGGKVGYKDARIQALIDRFLEHTDFKFECCEIVGRTFPDVADHAAHLREGGCARLLEALTAIE